MALNDALFIKKNIVILVLIEMLPNFTKLS